MRYFAMLFALLVAAPSAQAPTIWVSISEGVRRAGLAPTSESYTTGGPWAAIPAQRLNADSQLSADHFRIRSWFENGAARVVVFAVVEGSATTRETETLISTFAIKPGDSVEVTQTERYGAAHVVVSASAQPPVANAGQERRYLNVRLSLF
jgi:hypothetical protein